MKSVMAIFFSILVAALLANSVIGLANKISENDDSRIEEDKFSMQAKFPYDGIRLPGNVLPLEYKVFLHPNITDDKFKFTGSVKIILDVKRETDSIIVHSKSLTHVYTGVFEHGHGINVEPDIEKEVPVTGTLTHEKHEMLMVQLGSRLSTKKKYLLYITFAGELASFLRGFYRSSYKTKTGEQRYLATTHFEATGARLAFPCFDEPAMKSHLSIVMVREPRHTALSNMPLEKTHVRKDGLLEDHFVKSVKMSTYLVAFVVCDFAHLSATSSRGIKVKVWAPEHLISQAELAIKAAPKILDYYEKFFKIDFPLPKQDLIAIPDFAMGAMENWGLITYRSTDLLFDEKQSSAANRQRVIVVIAHELAHQWFGNLVTMQWWNDIWLNEGFAAFVEYIGANITDPSMQMMDQFVNDNVHSALALDSKLSSHPISMPLSDPADIGGVFDTISYQKGSSVIRMMRDFIRPDRFLNGLAYYLRKFRFGNAVSDDLYACLGKATGDTIDVKKIMHTWTLQMGYPVVNVVRDPQNNNMAIFTQERFVTDVKNENEIAIEMSPFNYKWEVPLTFYFQRNTKLQRKWLHLEDESLKHPWNQKSGWLKVNVDQIGFYRVNYDKENWKALAAQLKLDHTKLSGADRSNIIDDAFALAKAGKLSQVQALDLTEYLKHEKDYVPFASGMDSLSSIGGLLHHRPGYASYEKYILDQISPLVSELGWEDSGSQLNKFLRSIVLRSAVSHNKSASVKTAMKKYHEWMYHDKIVPVNLRSTVYLAGIKYGGQKEWDFMFQKFQNTIYPSEKRTLMFSLGDTSKLEILKSYLKKSFDQDVIKSQDTPHVIAKVASNAFGTVMARNFVKKNWNRLLIEHGTSTGLPRIISAVFGSGKTKAELSEAENFLNNHKLGSGKLAAKRAIAAIRNNINWLGKYEKTVEQWFKSKVKN